MRTTLVILAALLVLAPAAGADTFEPNDGPLSAYGPLQSGVPYDSYIGQADDQDYFYFDADLGAASVTLTGIPEGNDYDIYLVDIQGNILDPYFSENEGNSDESFGFFVAGSGRFWLWITGYQGTYSDTDPYTLTATFTPLNTDPVVEVLYPNGGETLATGAAATIQWSASDAEDGGTLSVDLAYSPDNGSSWTAIATGTDNDGSHPWTVPAEPTAQGLIRVTAADGDGGTAFDVSDAVFTIQTGTSAVLTLSVPQDLSTSGGSTLEVPVSFESNVDVAALQFALTFSSDLLTPQSVTAGPRAGGMTLESSTGTSGEVRVVIYSSSGAVIAPGAGVACTVSFQVAPSPAGNAALGFGDAVAGDASGASLPVTLVGADVTPVRGVTLAAEAAVDGVRLSWTAETDGAHAGFRVLREDRGVAVALHDGLLDPGTRSFTDRGAAPGATLRYWLEAVDRTGAAQRFGPVETTVPAGPLWAGRPYPNPSRAAVSLDVRSAPGTAARAMVVDLSGRVVRELDVPTAGTIAWDGRLRDGRPAPAGVYFLHLRQDGASITRRVVRLAGR